MMRRPFRVAAIVVAALGWGALSAPAPGQEATPLQKSDIVRLLTGGTYSEAEIAGMIRRACLSFEPTERDLQNFRSLGADDALMAAIQECVASGRVSLPGVGQPRTPPAEAESAPAPAAPSAPAEATLFLSPRRAEAAIGEGVTVSAELTFGAAPAGGVVLELREAAARTGPAVASATTDGNGVATLQVPAAGSAGTRRYVVVAPNRPFVGANLVEVETRGPTTPDVAPDRESASGEAEPPAAEEESVEETLARAESLSDRGAFGQADVVYERLVEERPNDIEVLASYGFHLARSGEHAEAERTLERARALDPSRMDVRKSLGFVALWRGDAEAAVEWFRTVTELAPADAEAWRGLGQALLETGREREARDAFRRADRLEGILDSP